MNGLTSLLAILVMSLVPALLFILLWTGLKRLQNQALINLAEIQADTPAKEVTWGDAFRGLAGLQDDYTGRDLLDKP